MILFIILLLVLGFILSMVSGVAIVLIDPIICIFIIWGMFKLIKKFTRRHD